MLTLLGMLFGGFSFTGFPMPFKKGSPPQTEVTQESAQETTASLLEPDTQPDVEIPDPEPEPDPVVTETSEPSSEPASEPVVVVTPILPSEPDFDSFDRAPTPDFDPQPIFVADRGPSLEPDFEPQVSAQNLPDEPDTPDTAPIIAPTSTADSLDLVSGRVATLETATDGPAITSVKILSGIEQGNITVNPDNTIAIVLSDPDQTGTGEFSYEATYANGAVQVVTQPIAITKGPNLSGWGEGDTYSLQTDEQGDTIVEIGENHRKIYISKDEDALSWDDIAALEGVDRSDIDAKFLYENPEYGGSPDMALKSGPGVYLWTELQTQSGDNSNWLMFERGYDYDSIGGLTVRGMQGEDELHPIHISAYGEGDAPIIDSTVELYQESSSNVVISDIHFTGGMRILQAENLLFEDITLTGSGLMNIQNVDGFTIRDSEIKDIRHEAPQDDRTEWWAHADRTQGLYLNESERILIENTLIDHNGWADDYLEDASDDGGQPPSQYSQNVYIQYTNDDVTFRDNITMQAASFGAQIRSGGFIEDNVFLDNNAGVLFAGGEDAGDGQKTGNYTLFTGNVVTSGAHKEAPSIGALTLGVDNDAHLSSLHENIVAHLADPNNAAELEDKYWNHDALISREDVYYNDTVVYNWDSYRTSVEQNKTNDENTDNVVTGVADQTTIQLYTAALLGTETATIQDLSDYLRQDLGSSVDGQTDADLIAAYFREGFGVEAQITSDDAQVFRFAPSDLGEGTRWDNRLNWDQDTLPGAHDGDSIQLAGNWVTYGGTTTIEDLDFGEGGKLYVGQGYLKVDGALTTSSEEGGSDVELDIARAGQFWTNGFDSPGRLDVDIEGGRFANYGDFTGDIDLSITDGQAILATGGANMDLSADSRIVISGNDTRIGFDGTDDEVAALRLEEGSILGYTAEDGSLGTLREFRSGHFGEGKTDVQSGVNLGQSKLHLDITDLAGSSGTHWLVNVDEIVGTFSKVDVQGLADDQDAHIVVDYETDSVTLDLTAAGTGTGTVSYEAIGDMSDAELAPDLWTALTEGQSVLSEAAPTLEESEDLGLHDGLPISDLPL